MGLAKLSKVTVISPRSEYPEVAKALARFEDFHPITSSEPDLDPKLQELSIKAVRLFAQADQAAKDLAVVLMPGMLDILFRGVKIPTSEFEASSWEALLNKAEAQLTPIAEQIKAEKAVLQRVSKQESDLRSLREALGAVSGFSGDVGALNTFVRLKAVLVVVGNGELGEFEGSLPSAILVTRPLGSTATLVLVVSERSDEARIDKTLKAFDLKSLMIPPDLPQNPAEAYAKLTEESEEAQKQREEVETRLAQLKVSHQTVILAVREIAEVARETLDHARVSGSLKRLATISGYVPARRESEFEKQFGAWMVYSEPVTSESDSDAPTLMENPTGVRTFQLITSQQGTPGSHEVDPTPLVSFVFPVFFGMMFGDFGHGIIVTLFALLIRQRGRGSLRQWGNVFLAAGLSAIFFGAIFGEFFGYSLYHFIPIPPLLDIVQRPLGANATIDTTNIEKVMLFALEIGVIHLTTGLALDIYESLKAHEGVEVLVNKIPTLTMYLSGVCYGISFFGAGYSFNVLKVSTPAPLLGIPNNELGAISLGVLIPSMIVLLSGKGIAILAGKLQGESVGEAFANGGLEVFERISQFLSNTVSYVRLAIMLLVHAVLLLTVIQLLPLTNLVNVVPWIIFNALILSFEALIVYVQDLRLHIYEFFTKFFRGTGKPFKRIIPDRARTRINWA